MRPRLHRKALTRFVVGLSVAVVLACSLLLTVGASAAPVAALSVLFALMLAGSAMVPSSRRRVTRSR
jgi:hypothetical protein